MFSRRVILAAALAASVFPASMALAADGAPFEPKAFEAAQAAGKKILVEVSAPWCPVCTKQKPIISKLLTDPDFKDMTRFVVDFDSQKDALRSLRVQRQSTLIVFKGDKEVGRSVGVTDPAAIEMLMSGAI